MRRARKNTKLRLKNGHLKTETFDGTLDELYAEFEHHRILVELAQYITSNSSIDNILETILDHLNHFCGSERSLILIFDQTDNLIFL